MGKKSWLITILFISVAWQPSHHHLMVSGMSMTPEVHSFIIMIPFLASLLFLSKAN